MATEWEEELEFVGEAAAGVGPGIRGAVDAGLVVLLGPRFGPKVRMVHRPNQPDVVQVDLTGRYSGLLKGFLGGDLGDAWDATQVPSWLSVPGGGEAVGGAFESRGVTVDIAPDETDPAKLLGSGLVAALLMSNAASTGSLNGPLAPEFVAVMNGLVDALAGQVPHLPVRATAMSGRAFGVEGYAGAGPKAEGSVPLLGSVELKGSLRGTGTYSIEGEAGSTCAVGTEPRYRWALHVAHEGTAGPGEVAGALEAQALSVEDVVGFELTAAPVYPAVGGGGRGEAAVMLDYGSDGKLTVAADCGSWTTAGLPTGTGAYVEAGSSDELRVPWQILQASLTEFGTTWRQRAPALRTGSRWDLFLDPGAYGYDASAFLLGAIKSAHEVGTSLPLEEVTYERWQHVGAGYAAKGSLNLAVGGAVLNADVRANAVWRKRWVSESGLQAQGIIVTPESYNEPPKEASSGLLTFLLGRIKAAVAAAASSIAAQLSSLQEAIGDFQQTADGLRWAADHDIGLLITAPEAWAANEVVNVAIMPTLLRGTGQAATQGLPYCSRAVGGPSRGVRSAQSNADLPLLALSRAVALSAADAEGQAITGRTVGLELAVTPAEALSRGWWPALYEHARIYQWQDGLGWVPLATTRSGDVFSAEAALPGKFMVGVTMPGVIAPELVAQGYPIGDLDRNGTVDAGDLSSFIGAWRALGQGEGRIPAGLDLNGDGAASLGDAAMMLQAVLGFGLPEQAR